MIGCVVQNENIALPPVDVMRIEVLTKLGKKQAKGLAVILAAVDGVPYLACAAQ